MAGLQDVWKGFRSVHGNRSLAMAGKALGQYNLYQDPKFYKDMERFEQNPTSQNADLILSEYGDQLDIEDKKSLAKKIQPVEGTMANQKQDLAEMKIENNKQYQEKLGDLGYYDTKAREDYQGAKSAISDSLTNIAKNKAYRGNDVFEYQAMADKSNAQAQNINNEVKMRKAELALENNLPEQEVQTRISNLNANQAESLYNKKLFENKADKANKIVEYFMRNKNAQTRMNEAQATQAGINTDIAQATKEDQILQQEYRTENARMQNEQLDTQLGYLDQQLQNKLTQQDLNIINQRIQNDIAKLREEKQRRLTPMEIKSIELRNKNAALNNDLKENKVWQSNQRRKYMEQLDDRDMSSALGLTENSSNPKINKDRLVTNPLGGGAALVNDNNILVDPQTKNPITFKGKDGKLKRFVYNNGISMPLPVAVGTNGANTNGGNNQNRGTPNSSSESQVQNSTIKNPISIIEMYKSKYNIGEGKLYEALNEEVKNNPGFKESFESNYGVPLKQVMQMLEIKKGRS